MGNCELFVEKEKEKSAEKVDRTPDLMIFSHTLSQLSYLGSKKLIEKSILRDIDSLLLTKQIKIIFNKQFK